MNFAREGWRIEACLAKGKPIPPELIEPPMLPGDVFYISAFWDLSTCRQIGFSPGPIPWNRVCEYSEFAGLDRDNAFVFAQIIRAMDGAYLDDIAERQARDAKMKASPVKVEAKPN